MSSELSNYWSGSRIEAKHHQKIYCMVRAKATYCNSTDNNSYQRRQESQWQSALHNSADRTGEGVFLPTTIRTNRTTPKAEKSRLISGLKMKQVKGTGLQKHPVPVHSGQQRRPHQRFTDLLTITNHRGCNRGLMDECERYDKGLIVAGYSNSIVVWCVIGKEVIGNAKKTVNQRKCLQAY